MDDNGDAVSCQSVDMGVAVTTAPGAAETLRKMLPMMMMIMMMMQRPWRGPRINKGGPNLARAAEAQGGPGSNIQPFSLRFLIGETASN